MKASKEKTAAAARDSKRRLENPLTEAHKVAEAERQRKIKQMADKKCENLRVMAERRSLRTRFGAIWVLKPWLNYFTVEKSTLLWKNKRTNHSPVR